MRLNDVDILRYEKMNDTSFKVVLNKDYDEVSALDKVDEYTITDDDDNVVEVFGNYHLVNMNKRVDDRIEATFVVVLEPDTAKTIKSISKDLSAAKETMKSIKDMAELARRKATESSSLSGTLSGDVDVYGGAIEELATMVESNLTNIDGLLTSIASNSTMMSDMQESVDANSSAIEEIAAKVFSEVE